jgi:biopolymer transport protein TolQ
MRRAIDDFERRFWSGESLDELVEGLEGKTNIGTAAVFESVMREYRHSLAAERLRNVQERLRLIMTTVIEREVQRLEKGLLLLSTFGSFAGAFIGLAGAIWGIMASAQPTGIGVSMVGIELVLLAAVIAVATSVPAKVFNDKFVVETKRLKVRMEGFGHEFAAITSRHLEMR